MAAVRKLFNLLVRNGTRTNHVRGLRDFLAYTHRIGVRQPLPATEDVVLCYIAYSLMERGVILDAATVDGYLGGVPSFDGSA